MFKSLKFLGSLALAAAGGIGVYQLTHDILWAGAGALVTLGVTWVFLGKDL